MAGERHIHFAGVFSAVHFVPTIMGREVAMDIFALTDLFCTVLQRGVKWRPVKNRKHFEGGGIAPNMLVTTD